MRWMRDHQRDYLDSVTGQVDRDRLVSGAATVFKIYEFASEGTPLPQWLYDVADQMPFMSPAY
jgi:hypothetical protein